MIVSKSGASSFPTVPHSCPHPRESIYIVRETKSRRYHGEHCTLQCDGGIVVRGDSEDSDREKCGDPQKILSPDPQEPAVWVYNFGSTEFFNFVSIVNGNVERIQMGDYGGNKRKIDKVHDESLYQKTRRQHEIIRLGLHNPFFLCNHLPSQCR
jgi:hypothetical protein